MEYLIGRLYSFLTGGQSDFIIPLSHQWHGWDVAPVLYAVTAAGCLGLLYYGTAGLWRAIRRKPAALPLLIAMLYATAAYAASTKLSSLSAGSAISDTDLFYDVQTAGIGGVKITGAQLKTYFGFTASGGIVIAPSGLSSFQLMSGPNGGGSLPVPTLYPTQANSTIAVDFSPKGSPTDIGFGMAWNDICNTDQVTSGGLASQCLHLSARGSAGMEVGTAEYNSTTVATLNFGRFNGDTGVFTSDIIIPTAGGFQLPTIANASGNEILCYNSTGGAVTWEPAVASCVPSGLQFKNPIALIDPQHALAGIVATTPAVYSYKPETGLDTSPMDGLYADQVCAIDERLCFRDEQGRAKNYDKVGALAIAFAAIKAEHQEIEQLKKELKRR